jgi:hypothetical protein
MRLGRRRKNALAALLLSARGTALFILDGKIVAALLALLFAVQGLAHLLYERE